MNHISTILFNQFPFLLLFVIVLVIIPILTEKLIMKEMAISQSTRQKTQQVKRYIQKKYNLTKLREEQRKENWKAFEEKVRQLNLTIEEREHAKKHIITQEMQDLRKRREKISKKKFECICVIGRGAFGQVRLCREKKNGRIVAIKCLRKKEMIKKNQQGHLKAERNILADGGEWIVELLYSFQDQNYLYLVMEYLGGGDLMNLLIARNVLEQHEAKFYAAEIVLAIESIHKKNYIHRDMKPDNVLIDSKGHIKLSDFGLCKETETTEDKYVNEAIHDFVPGQISNSNLETFKKYLQKYSSNAHRNRKLAFSAVGTPDYIAPQMLKRTGYTELVDWWAVGVIIYEMLIGYAPFSCENNEETYFKIQNHEEYLYFPPQVPISFEVVDIISRLLSEQSTRLGRNGAEEVKAHPWFKDINWSQIKNMKPPFVPELQSSIDAKYFDKYDQSEPWLYDANDENHKKDFNFIGYTYKIQADTPKNYMKEQLERLQVQKNQEKERVRGDMKKKNKIAVISSNNQQISYSRNLFQKLQLGDYSNRSQINTERSKGRKTKSPLNAKDTNRMKTKQSVSKSPIKLQNKTQRPSGLTRKVAPLNLQSLALNSMVYASTQLNKTLTTRRSIKKYK